MEGLQYHTYTELVIARKEQCPDLVYTHLIQDNGDILEITYSTLYEKALQFASCLAHYQVQRQDRVVIILPTGTGFIYSLFGCYLAAACPVPAYPPFRLYDIAAYVKNLSYIIRNCEPKVVIAFDRAKDIIQSAIHHSGLKIPLVLEQELEQYPASRFEPICPDAHDLGLIQYTSGSTGLQKGVTLDYHNLLVNNHLVGLQGNPDNERVVQVSWLPLYHDMGLISSLLTSLYLCHPFILMSPQYFLLDPKNWLWAIHKFRGTLSLAPNFAYSLCLKKIRDEEIEGLDLSSWNNAGCAAEPIDSVIMDGFIERYSKYGLPETAVTPYYGLAELTVAATGFPVKEKYIIDTIDREHLEKAGIAQTTNKKKGAIRVVCVGPPLDGHEVNIINELGEIQPLRREGEIIIKGPCVMKGYYRAPDVTSHVLKDDWIHSGDLGYLTEDGLYITGRKKDVIIKGGRNFYPHLLESVTQGVEGIRKGCVVAFGVPNEKTGTENIVILAETRLNLKEYREVLQNKVREAVLSTFNCMPDVVEILPSDSLHKTSSGKIQRSACRESYVKGFFRKKRPRAWLSLLKIYGENRIQSFRGFFQDQRWSRIWQRPEKTKGRHYQVIEDALIELPDNFDQARKKSDFVLPICDNFQQLLLHREQHNAGEIYGYILEHSGQQRQLSYHNIFTEAHQYAFGLRKMSVGKGERVVIILPKKDFIPLFFACTLTGSVPVPVQPPFHLYQIHSYIQYLVHILDDCRPSLVITFSDVREITQAAILKSKHQIRHINVESLVIGKYCKVHPAKINAEDPAFIQYTPGTIDLPRGVVFSHANLLNNVRSIHKRLEIQRNDILVAWITLYEMSSIVVSLCAFWGNFPVVLISPDWALQNPKIWLWTIHKFKGTISLAPALFYQQCNELPEEDMRGLDLRSWRTAIYGDDADLEMLQKFISRCRPYHFNENALVACYLPSEIGFVAALSMPNQGIVLDHKDFQRMERKRHSVRKTLCLSMGRPLPDYQIRVVDKEQKVLEEGYEGDIQLRCPSGFKGYFKNIEKEPIEWARTGDMGYVRDGQIFLTGHKETLIYKNGRVYYPHLLEGNIERIEGVRSGGVVAMGVENNDTEEMVILAEVQLGIRKTNYEITHEIQKILQNKYQCCPDEIILLPPHMLPRTMIGSIQRSMCLENYYAGKLHKRPRRMWLEMLKIYSGNRLRRLQDSVKIWQWFRIWRERRRSHDNDPAIVQKEMAQIIAGEMDIALSQLGPEVNLMKDLGLDSLKAIELLAIMEENFEVSIPNNALENYTSITGLAHYICELRSDQLKEEATISSVEEIVAQPAIPKSAYDSELLVISALNRSALIQRIQALQKYIEQPRSSIATLCYNLASLEGNYRLSLVVDSWEDLQAKLQESLEEISRPGKIDIEDPRGIYYFSTKKEPGKLALIFPGQGVQYSGMLQDLRNCFPVVNDTFVHFDKLWNSHNLPAISHSICGDEGNSKDLVSIQVSQPAILASDLALYRLLNTFSVKPDVVAGHSYGEFIAAYTSGVFQQNVLEEIGLGAAKLVDEELDKNLAMAAISTTPEKVQDIIRIIPGALYIANKNCDVQTVIAGDKTAVSQAVKICRAIKIMAEELPIPYAFHSPLAGAIHQTLQNSLEKVALQSPEIPIYSCMTGDLYPQGSEQILPLLCRQIIEPVVFDKMIQNMYRDGVRFFIEVGPRNILTNFIRRVLHDKECCAVATNHHLRSGIAQINHMLALLTAKGISVALENLYAHRNVSKDIGIVSALSLGA